MREHLASIANSTAAVLPDYETLWRSASPDLSELLATRPVEQWIAGFSRLLSDYSQPSAGPHFVEEKLVHSALSDRQKHVLGLGTAQGPTHIAFEPFSGFVALLIACAESSAGGEFSYDHNSIRDCIRAAHCTFTKMRVTSDGSFENNLMGAFSTIIERSIVLTATAPTYGDRCYGILKWNHRHVSNRCQKAREFFDFHLRAKHGISLDDWATTGMLLGHVARKFGGEGRQVVPSEWVALPTRLQSAHANCVRFLSTTLAEFQARCSAIHSHCPMWERPNLSPLEQTPMLVDPKRPGTAFVMSYTHIPKVLLESVANLGPNKQEARGYFGDLVEAYVHMLGSHVFGDKYEVLDQENLADAVLWRSRGAYALECKSSITSESYRYQTRTDEDAKKDLKSFKYLAKAASQCENTLRAVIDGRLTPPTKRYRGAAFGKIFVTYEQLPSSMFAEELLAPFLPKTIKQGGVLKLSPLLLSLHELEQLDRYPHVDLLWKIERKQRHEKLRFESLLRVFREEKVSRRYSDRVLVTELNRELERIRAEMDM